jgi:ribosomal protein L1
MALLHGRRIPAVGEPSSRSNDDVQGRLAVIEYRLDQIMAQLATIGECGHQIEQLNKNIEALTQIVSAKQQGARR